MVPVRNGQGHGEECGGKMTLRAFKWHKDTSFVGLGLSLEEFKFLKDVWVLFSYIFGHSTCCIRVLDF